MPMSSTRSLYKPKYVDVPSWKAKGKPGPHDVWFLDRLSQAWSLFVRIPCDLGKITQDFMWWKKGAAKYGIVLWFERKCPNGIMHDLIYDVMPNEKREMIDSLKKHPRSLDELKKLWKEFSEVPINNDDEIECNFLDFEAGTDRFEIWEWFDVQCPNGLKQDLVGTENE